MAWLGHRTVNLHGKGWLQRAKKPHTMVLPDSRRFALLSMVFRLLQVSEFFADRPFALSIGPQRAATSWLDHYLRSRGDVCLPHRVKETYFLNRFYEKGCAHYAAHFRVLPAHRLRMEITTQSFDCAAAPLRTRDVLGRDVRLVCPLRHPVARSYSLYRHYLRYGIVRGSLRDAIEQVPQILTSSHYTDHLARWRDIFDETQIAFLLQEELERAPDMFVRRVCASLNLPYVAASPLLQYRCNASRLPVSPAIAQAAQKFGDWLRARNGYGVINAAKSLGLKRWIFGLDKPLAEGYVMPLEDKAWLTERLLSDVEAFENLTGRIFPEWHSVPHHDTQRAA